MMEDQYWLPLELWSMVRAFVPKYEIAMCLVDKTFHQMFKDTKLIALHKQYHCGLRYKQMMQHVREKYLTSCALGAEHDKLISIIVWTPAHPGGDDIAINHSPDLSSRSRSHRCIALGDSHLRSLMYKILDPKTVFKGHKMEGLQKVHYSFYSENSVLVCFTHRDSKLSKVRKARDYFLVE